MSVHSAVLAAMEGVEVVGWKRALILSLAESMDATPHAAKAHELRLLMQDVERERAGKVDPSDELQKRRRQRRAVIL